MKRFVHRASVLGRVSVLLVVVASALAAQVSERGDHTADVLTRMRVDLSEQRYATVIRDANGLLESARAITTLQRIELFQLLAAAYYPDATGARQLDSARLPLTALIRLAPDSKLPPEFSWPGLDELIERTRAGSFAVVTRPQAEYTLGARGSPIGYLSAVASRRTRFRLTSVDAVSGRTVVHDVSAFVTAAELQLRTHDANGPIFTDGMHHLHIWAHDLNSGDSVLIAHRVRAIRSDSPPPTSTADSSATVAVLPLAPAVLFPDRQSVATSRSTMLWGGLALAAATAVFAQQARPDDGFRAAYRVDPRALVVGAVMATAAVANFFTSRSPLSPTAQVSAPSPAPAPTTDTYRVRLLIDPLEP